MEQHQHPRSNPILHRRNILKLLAAVPTGAAISLNRDALASPQNPDGLPDPKEVAASHQPKVLRPHEWKTISVLCDLVIPADERSAGATAAGVPAFIDDWLDFQRGNVLDEIRGGLTWLDIESNRKCETDFADCAPAQQRHILDRIAYPQKAAPEDLSAVAFFNRFRDLVISGFYTSEIGIRDLPYLGNEPQSEWRGCPDPVLVKLAIYG